MAITLVQAKTLHHGDILHVARPGNKNGCANYKVNGQVKTWKRDASKVQVPVKHGLYVYDYVTESDLGKVHLSDGCLS
jgi:hypothetical protein